MKRCLSCWTSWLDASRACPLCGGLRVDPHYSPSPLEDQVLQAIRGQLAMLKTPLVAELRGVARRVMPGDTYLIDFEAHPGEFHSGFGVRWDPMDAEVTQLDGGGPLLPHVGPLVPPEVSRSRYFEQLPVASIAFHVLPNWFADCWSEAGGGECLYPAYLSEHDGLAFDLTLRCWDINGERWPA